MIILYSVAEYVSNGNTLLCVSPGFLEMINSGSSKNIFSEIHQLMDFCGLC